MDEIFNWYHFSKQSGPRTRNVRLILTFFLGETNANVMWLLQQFVIRRSNANQLCFREKGTRTILTRRNDQQII